MSEYLIREEDFADDISRLIFRLRKEAFEKNDYSCILRLVARLHNWFVERADYQNDHSAEEALRQIERRKSPLAIFGCGYAGSCCFSHLQKEGLSDRVACFIDSDPGKQHSDKYGREVISLRELISRNVEYLVVLPVSVYTGEMRRQLEEEGFPDKRICLFPVAEDFTRYLRKRDDLESVLLEKHNRFLLLGDGLPEIIFGNLLRASDISFRAVPGIQKDQKEDRELIESCLSDTRCYFICMNGGMTEQLLQRGVPEERILQFVHQLDEFQYFDPEVGALHKQGTREVFIDGGSCDLTTSIRFLNWCNSECDRIYAFECDKRGIVLCKERLNRSPELSSVAELIPKGLWSKETTLHFREDAYVSGSNVTGSIEEGTTEIETESIDHVLQGEKATFIKMDIEGSELEALKGAERTIRKWHPFLAISLYHKLEDIVEIPSYIKSIVPEYRLYIRNYHEEYTETVLYAIYSDAAGSEV